MFIVAKEVDEHEITTFAEREVYTIEKVIYLGLEKAIFCISL